LGSLLIFAYNVFFSLLGHYDFAERAVIKRVYTVNPHTQALSVAPYIFVFTQTRFYDLIEREYKKETSALVLRVAPRFPQLLPKTSLLKKKNFLVVLGVDWEWD
jgi:hypothetical protein